MSHASKLARLANKLSPVNSGKALIINEDGDAIPTILSLSGGGQVVAKMNFSGNLIPVTGIARFYPNRDISLVEIYFSVGDSSSGAIEIDLLKNGVSVLGGILPRCLVGEYVSNTLSILDISLSTSDYLTVNIVTASSGKDLVAHIVYQ